MMILQSPKQLIEVQTKRRFLLQFGIEKKEQHQKHPLSPIKWDSIQRKLGILAHKGLSLIAPVTTPTQFLFCKLQKYPFYVA